jgi:hypothetical protein
MKTAAVVAALLTLGLVGLGAAREPAGGGKSSHIPGDALWDYGAWADDYLVIATSYDSDTREVTWTLKARKRVTARRYQARFTDPDLIELEARSIRLTPAREEYAKNAQIKAVMKLPPRDVMQEANRVTIGNAP